VGGGLSPCLKIREKIREGGENCRFEFVHRSLVGMASSGTLGG
jgi:hypothetical protein